MQIFYAYTSKTSYSNHAHVSITKFPLHFAMSLYKPSSGIKGHIVVNWTFFKMFAFSASVLYGKARPRY